MIDHESPVELLDVENPWPGLAPFKEGERRFFYGRDSEAGVLFRSVLDAPITLLYGRSGLGKTSLLCAGLFPALRSRNYLPIYVRLDYEAGAPAIADQLRHCIRDSVEAEAPGSLPPSDSESAWEYLHRTDVELWSSRNFLLTPVLVIDQFEEAFTLGPQVVGRVQQFRDDLGDLVENRIPASFASRLEDDEGAAATMALRSHDYRVIISLREDFLPDIESWRQLIPTLGASRFRLLALSTDAALEAVFQPASDLMTFDQAKRVVRFIAGANPESRDGDASGDQSNPLSSRAELNVEPALLSLFCRGLNEAHKLSGRAQFDDQLIDGAERDVLDNYYSNCVGGLPARVARFVEDELITQRGFRNSYAREDAVPSRIAEEELAQLIRSRLVRIEERYGTQRIELSHDILTSVVRKKRDHRNAEEAQGENDVILEIVRATIEHLTIRLGAQTRDPRQPPPDGGLLPARFVRIQVASPPPRRIDGTTWAEGFVVGNGALFDPDNPPMDGQIFAVDGIAPLDQPDPNTIVVDQWLTLYAVTDIGASTQIFTLGPANPEIATWSFATVANREQRIDGTLLRERGVHYYCESSIHFDRAVDGDWVAVSINRFFPPEREYADVIVRIVPYGTQGVSAMSSILAYPRVPSDSD